MCSSKSQADTSEAQPRFNRKRMLVVEAELETRGCIVNVLQACGAEVEAVDSLQAGLSAIAHHRPDVIISALQLPDGNGYNLITELRQFESDDQLETIEQPKIGAIAVSSSLKEIDLDRALHAGFQRLIVKPIEPHRLIAVVASLTERNERGCW
jgi:CheY-like chemotaxis protein